MASSATVKITATLRGNFGRLWSRGHETLTAASPTASSSSRIVSVSGPNVQTYLQGLLTCDVFSDPVPPREEERDDDGMNTGAGGSSDNSEQQHMVQYTDTLRSTCFLDNKGRIITDALLWKLHDEQYYIEYRHGSSSATAEASSATETDAATNAMLEQHLKMFRTRRQRKIQIEDVTDRVSSHVIYGTQASMAQPPEGYLAGLDPRHPSLGLRLLSINGNSDLGKLVRTTDFPDVPGTYDFIRRLAGIAEGPTELQSKIALESNQEFLQAVSFTKGCYLGQELTARVQHTGAIRKRIVPMFLATTEMQIPQPWLIASRLQANNAGNDATASESSKANHAALSSVLDVTLGKALPPLPRLSIAAAGTMVGVMTGQASGADNDNDENTASASNLQRRVGDSLVNYCSTQLSHGQKIVDTNDGATIGQIVAPPTEGTNVVLAQLRLDRLGLLGGPKARPWTHQNKVTIGGGPEVRFLPYLPLWWPEIDPATGKAKVMNDDDIDNDDSEIL